MGRLGLIKKRILKKNIVLDKESFAIIRMLKNQINELDAIALLVVNNDESKRDNS